MKHFQSIFYGALMFIGFIMALNESSTFAPNFIGLIFLIVSAYNLKLFHFQRNEQ